MAVGDLDRSPFLQIIGGSAKIDGIRAILVFKDLFLRGTGLEVGG